MSKILIGAGVGVSYGMMTTKPAMTEASPTKTVAETHRPVQAGDGSLVEQPEPVIAPDRSPSATSRPAAAPNTGAVQSDGIRVIHFPGGPAKVSPQPSRPDSNNPEWVACTAKQNDMYVAHNQTISLLNNYKSTSLRELDDMYARGEFAVDDAGNQLPPSAQYEEYQAARSVIISIYDQQIAQYGAEYQAEWDAQMRVCRSTYDF